jgi:D-3-phosphoglycerate dehydrogenase
MLSYRVLIADPVSDKLISLLEKNWSIDYKPDVSIEELKRIIEPYSCIIIRGRLKIDSKILERARNLKLIVRYGVGLDNIDLKYCRERGIKVFNTPKAFTEAVAELTMALILGILRGVGDGHFNIKKGVWIKKQLVGRELMDKTIGIIGFGRIGRRLAELLEPFNVEILAYDIIPVPKEYINRGVKQVDLDTLLRLSDIISIHVPLTPETYHLLNSRTLGLCKEGAYIINTSRGGVVDEEALKKLLREGKIGGIALDVFEDEPNPDRELLEMERTLFTPHIGAQTVEARDRAIYEVVEILKEHL